MNKTKIDWCDYTWNPVTGCYHGCEYCYARKIANRFGKIDDRLKDKFDDLLYSECFAKPDNPFPNLFKPTFHRYRLDEPKKLKKPSNIFVVSMGDLFGSWVPDSWIKNIFKACKEAPQHRYLFLTKNPRRYESINDDFENFWYGATVTDNKSYELALSSFMQQAVNSENTFNTFLSIEPILEDINIISYDGYITLVKWIIVGAETGNRKDKVRPKKEWIIKIKDKCKEMNIPIFMKESLRGLMGNDFVQEFPW